MTVAVLVAEQEEGTGSFLERHLADDGFEIVRTSDGEATLDVVESVRPDLVLLGVEVDVCRRLREGEPGRSWNRGVPVIVLGQPTADAVDRVRAFERGCDDFVPRPFLYDELLARIRAVLRRAEPSRRELLEAGEIAVDKLTRCVTVAGTFLPLPAKEFELLAMLATSPTTVFTKQDLLRSIWGYRAISRTRTIDSHACRLRGRIAELTVTPYVLNEWGVGYRLMLPLFARAA